MPLCCGLVFYLFDPFLICALHVVLMIRHKRLNHARQHFTVAAQIVGGINYVKLKLLKCSSLLWEMIWCHTPEAVLRCFSPSIQTFISALTGTSTSDKMCHSHSVRAVLSQSRGIRLVLMTSHFKLQACSVCVQLHRQHLLVWTSNMTLKKLRPVLYCVNCPCATNIRDIKLDQEQ